MKTVDFSETVATSDLKGYKSRHIIEYMKIRGPFGTFVALHHNSTMRLLKGYRMIHFGN